MRLLLKYVLCSNQPLGLQSLSINWFLYDTTANCSLAHIFMLCLRFARTYLEFFFFLIFSKETDNNVHLWISPCWHYFYFIVGCANLGFATCYTFIEYSHNNVLLSLIRLFWTFRELKDPLETNIVLYIT